MKEKESSTSAGGGQAYGVGKLGFFPDYKRSTPTGLMRTCSEITKLRQELHVYSLDPSLEQNSRGVQLLRI
jgi:hypothetical protein